MRRVDAPKSGTTTYHRDGTVTVWDLYRHDWVRGSDPGPRLLSTLTEERSRILRHTGHVLGRGPGRPAIGESTRRITVRVAQATYDRLEAEAKARGLTVSQLAREAIALISG